MCCLASTLLLSHRNTGRKYLGKLGLQKKSSDKHVCRVLVSGFTHRSLFFVVLPYQDWRLVEQFISKLARSEQHLLGT